MSAAILTYPPSSTGSAPDAWAFRYAGADWEVRAGAGATPTLVRVTADGVGVTFAPDDLVPIGTRTFQSAHELVGQVSKTRPIDTRGKRAVVRFIIAGLQQRRVA